MNRAEALEAVSGCRVGHLATMRPDGNPHIVPITFALNEGAIVTMVDHKPKTTRQLQRLTNIENHPRVSVVVDHYSEDWSELWWVRVDGRAEIHHGDEVWVRARQALAAKYEPYRARPPEGPAIVIAIDDLTSWASTA